MRNLKKLLAVIVAICVLATFTVPAFAADEPVYGTQAATLNELGLYDGINANSFDPDLGTAVDRQTGIALLVKMLGKKDAALAMSEAAQNEALSAFNDLADLAAWAKPYMAYAIANGLSNGTSTTTVSAKAAMTGNMFATLMLRNLGYTVTDFTTGLAMLQEKGGLTAEQAAAFNGNLVKDDIVGMAFGALSAVGSDGKMLIEVLIADGVVTEEAAIAAGLVTGEIALDSVAITGIKKVTVAFNQAVDTTKAVIKIKKGAAIYFSTAAFDDAKKVATLTTVTALPAGDYTVEVTGLTTAALTKAFTVTAEAAKTIEVSTATLDDATAAAKINFAVKNQYGEAMLVNSNTSGVVASAYNVTQNKVVTLIASANKYFEVNTLAVPDDFKLNDVIRVTITYAGITAQVNVTVQNPAVISTISLGSIVLAANDTRLNVADGTVKLDYTMADQYGAAAYLPATPATALATSISGVQFVSSNTAVISQIAVVNNADGKGEIVLTVAGAGSATITAIVIATGNTSTTTITVEANAAPAAAVITPPTTIVAGNDADFYLPVSVTDTYGDAYKSLTGLTVESSNTTAAAAALAMINGEVVIGVNPATVAASTSVTLSVKVGTTAIGTATFTVEPDAVATQVTAFSGPKVFEVGSTYTVPADKFTLLDQYGRAFTPSSVAVTETTDTSNIVTVTGAALTFHASNTGSAVITVAVNGVDFPVSISAIAASAIVSYEITPIATIYTAAGLDQTSPYAASITLVGKDAAGNAVNLVAGKINNVTVSNGTVGAHLGTLKVFGIGTTASTATVAVWNNATKLAEVAITTSNAAPVATSFSFANATSFAAQTVTVKDQYGVADTDAGFYYSSNTAVATVNASTGAITNVASGSTVITYVATNGTAVSYTYIN